MMAWEIDVAHPESSGTRVMARNPLSKRKNAREWHLVTTGYLRTVGMSFQKYRGDTWEADWSKRTDRCVWARNPHSKMPTARKWHWACQSALDGKGVKWQPKNDCSTPTINACGYIVLTPKRMSQEDIELAKKHGLFRGKRRLFVVEHRLVALKKYGYVPQVVRHFDGVKTNNHPDNLIAGTTQENTADHNTARLMSMYWHQKYLEAVEEITKLKGLIEST